MEQVIFRNSNSTDSSELIKQKNSTNILKNSIDSPHHLEKYPNIYIFLNKYHKLSLWKLDNNVQDHDNSSDIID